MKHYKCKSTWLKSGDLAGRAAGLPGTNYRTDYWHSEMVKHEKGAF
jgi:hypothetical protein